MDFQWNRKLDDLNAKSLTEKYGPEIILIAGSGSSCVFLKKEDDDEVVEPIVIALSDMPKTTEATACGLLGLSDGSNATPAGKTPKACSA